MAEVKGRVQGWSTGLACATHYPKQNKWTKIQQQKQQQQTKTEKQAKLQSYSWTPLQLGPY